MPKLFFYNNWHNGDIIFARPLVRRILDRYPDVSITWGCWRNHALLVQDLPVTVIADPRDDREPLDLTYLCPPDHVPVYVWVGQYPDTRHMSWRNVVEVYNRQVTARGLDLALAVGEVPMAADFPDVDVRVRAPAVYVENGQVRSMQSAFGFDMRALAGEFPDLNFYCTADPGAAAPNLFNCGRLNLVQLAALSNRCVAIVGKGSGTFACTVTEANRYKPQALVGFHSHDGPTFWEYPGCPVQYLEAADELRAFLHEVRRRPSIDVTTATAVPTVTPQVGSRLLPPDAPAPLGAAGGYWGLVADQIVRAAELHRRRPTAEAPLRQLMQGRYALARAWVAAAPDDVRRLYQGAMGDAHRAIQASNLKSVEYRRRGEELLEDAEDAFANDVIEGVTRGAGGRESLGAFLAASLYEYPQDLGSGWRPSDVPDWFVPDYLAFRLTPPPRPSAAAAGDDEQLVLLRDWPAYLARTVDQIAGTDPADAGAAEAFLAASAIAPGRAVAMFGFEHLGPEAFSNYADVVARACAAHDVTLVILDESGAGAMAPAAARAPRLPVGARLGLALEVLRRCRLAVGTPLGPLSNLAGASGTPHVIMLVDPPRGGPFKPYSALTLALGLPLADGAADGACTTHVSAGALAVAIDHVLSPSFAAADRPRVFVEDRWSWSPAPGEPAWTPIHDRIDRAAVDLYAVGRRGTWEPETRSGVGDATAAERFAEPLHWPWRHRPASTLAHDATASAIRAAAVVRCAETPLDDLLVHHRQQVVELLGNPRLRLTPASEEEWPLLDEILAVLARETHGAPQFVQFHLAAAAYLYPHEVPAPLLSLRAVPDAILPEYVQYALQSPDLFNDAGEAERFGDCLRRRLVDIADLVDGPEADPRLVPLLPAIATQINVIAAYFAPGDHRELMRARGRILEAFLRGIGSVLDFSPPPPGERIRLGIVQNQFVEHTETYATIPVYETLDRARFHVTLYALRESGTPIEAWCRRHAARFVVLPQGLERRVAAIRADGIDVLFFGMNLTAVTHDVTLLAAHRLARAQATSVCCSLTTGLSAIDYFLLGTGERDVADAQAGHTERLVQLPEPGMAFRFPERSARTPGFDVTRDALGIPRDAVVFVSGANFFKVIPELRAAWARLCAAVPNSVLLLYPFGPAWSAHYAVEPFIQQFRATLVEHGVDPARLVIANALPSAADIPALLKTADVYLDSFPYSGALSALDALDATLPVVTRAGVTQRAGQCAQLLRALGVGEDCIAADEADYHRRAVAFATDPALRRRTADAIRAAMAATPAFFDSAQYGRHVAQAFERMVEDAKTRRPSTLASPAPRAVPKLPATAPAARRFYGQFDPPVDAIIASYFPDDFVGGAIDVGATDGIFINNTLHFEQRGWDVVCVEANPDYARKLAGNRRRALNYAVSDEDRDDVTFHVVRLAQVNDYSSISSLEVDRELLERHRKMGFHCEEFDITVHARTLDSCLREAPMARVDFVSIDVEGVELRVLKGFDLKRWQPRLLVIENNTLEQSRQVTEYLRPFGYVLDRRAEVNDFFVFGGGG